MAYLIDVSASCSGCICFPSVVLPERCLAFSRDAATATCLISWRRSGQDRPCNPGCWSTRPGCGWPATRASKFENGGQRDGERKLKPSAFRRAYFVEQPRPGVGPPAFRSGLGNAEDFSRFLDFQADEVAQLDQFSLLRFQRGEPVEGFIECEQLVVGRGAGDFEFIHVQVLSSRA